MKAIKISGLLLTAICLFSLPSFSEDGITATSVTIGMSNVLSGPTAALGTGMKVGAEAFFDKVNKDGGVGGRKIKLVSMDDGYEPEKAVANTKKLIEEDKVFALFGYVGTPTSTAVKPLVITNNIPFFAPFTGAEFLRNPVTKNIFNIRASYFDETEQLVNYFVTKLNVKKIGLMIQDDAYGAAGKAGVMKAIGKRNMTLAGEGTYKRNTEDVDAAVAALKAAAPDAIVMIGAYKACAAFVKAAKAAGIKAKFANVSFVGTTAFIGAVGDAGEGVFISQVVPSPWDASVPVVKAYQTDMKVKGSDSFDYTSLEGYVAAKVFTEALKDKKVQDRETLKAALEKTNLDLGGFKVKFTADNHAGSTDVFLTEIKGGKAVPISVK